MDRMVVVKYVDRKHHRMENAEQPFNNLFFLKKKNENEIDLKLTNRTNKCVFVFKKVFMNESLSYQKKKGRRIVNEKICNLTLKYEILYFVILFISSFAKLSMYLRHTRKLYQ